MRGHRVLVVEYEDSVRELMCGLLAARGCEVERAATAGQALPLLLGRDYDLVICDLRLPGFDGRTLFEQVQAERPEMAKNFLICTGDTATRETRDFLSDTHLPVIFKPFRRDQLWNAVQPFLRWI